MRTEDAGRYLRTVSRLRPGQVWHRVRLTLRRAAWARMTQRVDARYRRRAAGWDRLRWDAPGLATVAALRAARRDPESALTAARDALAGRFTFLGESRELGTPPSWDRPGLADALLWKTHLHEFPYALDLALASRATGDANFRAGLFALLRSWSAAQPIGRAGSAVVAWNERAVATRLMHWCVAGALIGVEGPDAEWLAREVARHALFLRDNLALDLLANHLFRDVIALAFADALLPGICPDAQRLVEREVREQILPDGGHVERCPMYHAVCLQDLVELRALLAERAPAWLVDAVQRAGGFLESVLLGDGDIALLGDGWRGEVDVAGLLEQARASGPLRVPREPERHSGLVRLERGTLRLVARAGPHGPDYQLGHAHADLLSFEASNAGERVVVDTGTGAYQDGPMRRRLRSTAAHNTIALDGAELLEAWSSFRTGRRGRAHARARGETPRFTWLWAWHDGYRWLSGSPQVHRLFLVSADDLWVLDALLGRGVHHIASSMHLHPDLPSAAACIVPLAGSATRRSAPYHERFNETREMPELVVEEQAALPWAGGWWIGLAGGPEPAFSLRIHGGRIELRAQGRSPFALDWDVAGQPGSVSIR